MSNISSAVISKESSAGAPEIRIFISSTFRDMHDEREYIIKHIFPELRTICRERGVEFTEIDLRWGVTAEEAEQGKVLKICLDEIDRCRPYFIGILGERYGWVPNANDIKKDPELIAEYPWIMPCIENQTSVTEMEMLYGVLDNPSMADHAFFYFRDGTRTRSEFKETDPAIAGKLIALKDTIRESSFPVHENFPDPKTLGNLIREDLLKVINENFPLDEAPSPLEQKRLVQEAYAFTRRRAYIPRNSYIQKLDEHASGEEQPIVLTGESGSGKSALLAYWTQQHKQKKPDAFIVQHFIGAGSSDTGHLDIIQRIMEEIKARYDLEEEIPTVPEQLENDFSSWLAKVQKDKLILTIDSLDRLSGKSVHLTWLPKYFPPNIRVFLSSAGGETLEILEKREFDIFQVEPLTREESDKLIVHYLSLYRKALSKEQRALITQDLKSTNPLYLRTVLEELRIFGSFEELNNRINHYMAARDTSDLFQRMLARMEHDYDPDILDVILRLIWASRRGLAESEILEITGISRLELSPILHALEFQLMRRSGLVDFAHSYLRSAVDERYFKPMITEPEPLGPYNTFHLQIAEYFNEQEISARKADELPWQFEQAGEFEKLKLAISEIPMFMEYTKDDKKYELLGYWRKIGDLSVMEKAYDEKVETAAKSIETDPGKIYDTLGNFFKECGRNILTENYFEKAIELRSGEFGQSHDLTEESRFHHASLKWWIQGDYAGAKSLFLKILESRQAKFGRNNSATAKILYYLGTLERLQAHYPEAESLFHEAIATFGDFLGAEHIDSGRAMNELACLYLEKGTYKSAESFFQKAYNIFERTLGKVHPTTIEVFHNIAELHFKRGDRIVAEQKFREEIHQLEKIFGKEHPNTILALNNLASTLLHNGELKEARELFVEALELEEKVFGRENFHTAGTLNNLAETLDALGEYDESEKLYFDSWKTLESIFGKGHPITAHPIHGLGKLWLNKDNPAKAAEFFGQAYKVRHKALGSHPETAESLELYLNVLQRTDHKENSEELHDQLRAMKEALAGASLQ
jgi:nephrocystin-3